jgi:hypothetical protein
MEGKTQNSMFSMGLSVAYVHINLNTTEKIIKIQSKICYICNQLHQIYNVICFRTQLMFSIRNIRCFGLKIWYRLSHNKSACVFEVNTQINRRKLPNIEKLDSSVSGSYQLVHEEIFTKIYSICIHYNQ